MSSVLFIHAFVLVLLCICAVFSCADEPPVAKFPLQFTGNLEMTSHLVPENSEYPPRKRYMRIHYDFINKRAYAYIEKGYEAEKFHIRRYDTKNEYMIRLPPINDCKRSYLGEEMPAPDLSDAVYQEDQIVDEVLCTHYLHVEHNIHVHIYLSKDSGMPVQLVQESVEKDGTTTLLLTYRYTDVTLGEPAAKWFELPEEFPHDKCTRHIGGFPYLHIFHYFVRI